VAAAIRSAPTHFTASGSRSTPVRLSVKLSAPSSVASMPPRSTAEMRDHRPVAAEDGDMVVLQQRHRDLARRVDVDELGLRVLRRGAGEAGQVGLGQAAAAQHPVGERHDRDEPRR
jgi:hypothetical protein